MAGKTFRCRLVTPTASLLDEPVTYASVPAWDGLMGVLPGRAPILARLGTGELRLEFAEDGKGGGGGRSYLLDGGFVRMDGKELTILAESAQTAESLVEADAQTELTKALEAARGAGGKDAEKAAKLYHDADRARAKVRMAKSKRGI